jgi:hypothetical protein
MAILATCLILSSIEGRGAFGINVSTDENVYFPHSIADALSLEEFEKVEAVVIKNDRPDPMWKAIRARRAETSEV